MRVIFFGTSAFAVPSLERLIERRHDIVACVTQPDRPRGRGLRPGPSPVKEAALRLQLPLEQPQRPDAAAFASLRPDVGIVIAYGQLIGKDLLELPVHGMMGVHPSLLPKYRGAAPIAWALLNGEPATGITIFRLNERLDAGEVFLQEPVAIGPSESAEALTDRLARRGADALVTVLEQLAAGSARGMPQDDARASLAPKLTKAQGRIDWRQPAETIERIIRALSPWPGAATTWHGATMKVLHARVNEPAGEGQVPGAVTGMGASGLLVATGQGTLVITEVQPSGRRRMHVKEFLAGHPIQVGEQLGNA